MAFSWPAILPKLRPRGCFPVKFAGVSRPHHHTLRSQSHGRAASRQRAHRAVQLAVRAPPRRALRAAHRGYGHRAQQGGLHRRADGRSAVDGACSGMRVPGRAQPGEEYHQSRRGAIYARHSATLDARGLTYPCYCTPLELDLSRKAQLAAGRPPRYAGTCRELSPEARVRKSAQGISPTTRFRVPTGQARRVRRHGARRAALRHRRHRRFHPAARRRQRGVLLQQCHRRCGDGHHPRAARRGSPDQHAAPAAGARGARACARRPTATCRCWWARTARRCPSATAPPACASSASAAIYPRRWRITCSGSGIRAARTAC